ncbi:MAG: four helix bundle protein [Candidatus Absconditabacteria bacterium]
MIIKDVTDILVWQKAHALTNNILSALAPVEQSVLKQETILAALTVTRRIAFGFAVWSQGGFKDALLQAKADVLELRVLLLLMRDQNIIEVSVVDDFQTQIEDVSKLLYGFVKTFLEKTKKTTE